MNCAEIRALIGPAADNELPNVELVKVNEHLSGCADCQGEWERVLAVKSAIGDIARANDMSDAFEKKILMALRQEERSRRGKRGWVVAGLAAAASFLLFFWARSPEPAATVADKNAVNAERLVVGLNHHSDEVEDKSFDVKFVDTVDLTKLSSLAGFKLQPSAINSFDVYGADVVKSAQGKTLVRLCYTSSNKKYRTCIDCYQAPQGTIAFGGGTEETINGTKVRINRVANQSFLMVSHNGLDVVYSAAMPEEELLSLVKPNV